MRCGEAERTLVEMFVKCGQVGSMERLEAFPVNESKRTVERFDGTRLVFEGCGPGVLTQERWIDGLIAACVTAA